MFVNMVKFAIFFEAKPNSTVHHASANAILVRGSASITKFLTAFTSVCSNETKLPLFFIFKDEINGHIEKYIYTNLPSEIYASCQAKG